MLEVLDPEQNSNFYDNYLELDYDLSKVMFLATSNSLATIQPALRDRMEIIEVTGYTVEEKVQIAKRHLIKKHVKETGISEEQIEIPEETLEKICAEYTNESGVRGLDKRIAKVVRHRAVQIAMDVPHDAPIPPEELLDILGPSHEKERYEGNDVAGVVTGLAWTPAGGDILFIETSIVKGKGKLTLTGKPGRCDEGKCGHCTAIPQSPRRRIGFGPQGVRHVGRPCARACRCHSQGWPFGRHHHAHRAGVHFHPTEGAEIPGDDR